MKKKIYSIYTPPITPAKIIAQLGIIATSPSSFENFVGFLKNEKTLQKITLRKRNEERSDDYCFSTSPRTAFSGL